MLNILATFVTFAVLGESAAINELEIAKAAQELSLCEAVSNGRKARVQKDGVAYVLLATFLEDQGRGRLRPDYSEPESLCEVETFQIGADSVTVEFAGFAPGMMTLLYRFETDSDSSREVLVVYSGMLSFVQEKGPLFGVLEVQGDKVDIYAIYDGEPPYKQVRTFVQGILTGSEDPMLSAEWQEGEEELVITAFNSRLK